MNCGSEEDEAEVEEVEHFDDFTLASSWERFISEIEAVCRRWMADGPKNLLEKGAVPVGTSEDFYKAKYELKYDKKSYCMEYYFKEKHKGKVTTWDSSRHNLQMAFGVTEFLIIYPQSASGVVLDAPEACKLLSAVAIALSNCCGLWPAFVPVFDPSRKAHIGIQNLGTVFTRRFESDCIRSQVPVKLMHLEGLYELFVSKFAFSAVDFSVHRYKIHFTMRLTYRTLPYDDDDDYMHESEAENTESSVSAKQELHQRSQWDDDCPWSSWYSAEDPVKGFELVATWLGKSIESSLEMAEIENSSPHDAEVWLLLPILSEILNDGRKVKAVGFASQLSLLVVALEMSFEAQFLEDFVSDSSAEKLRSSAAIPPPTVIDRVLKELFHEGVAALVFSKGENKSSRAIKGAPSESLFAQFCLHALWLGNCNIRAIAILWIEFIREVRWCWEESQPLPKVTINDTIDLSSCLIYQKLQMLAICIEKKREANAEFFDATEDNDDVSGHIAEEHLRSKSNPPRSLNKGTHSKEKQHGWNNPGKSLDDLSSIEEASDLVRRGSSGVAGSMMLLSSCQRMHAPYTQDAPLMTEDMHEERLQAVAALSDSSSFNAQLEREILSSDMSAFKAANPDAVFEDFIRWHSPGDWISDGSAERESSGPQLIGDWPPSGRLSKRMSEQGNFWRKLWNDAPALPAYEQKLLLDPNREGEKILHYLETVRPHQLLEQMICTAFRASADTLNQASFGDLSQMRSKLDQLYQTMACTLRPLQANQLSQDTEIFEDLKRLCVVFGHVEGLIILSTSLHRKFILAPRLFNAIFNDYYNFYLPRMGNSEAEVDFDKEFNQKQQVSIDERNAVADLFLPPTATQSWRKVLSMGNLLNGHEPVLREIIFTTCDDTSNNHYAAHNPSGARQEIETYRMYIEGTSNDLGVALSVVSCD
ncbi:uncharacterized protein LOC130826744 isoform X2 [Amaranthus tricolor]|uniref:uncharacterized protein LOC130826744 isoform X2 n=1 Tax=Amaranthus tricolor TaxID=29722 RepID=UPI00258367EA|nr:uncharacterized protein LOC130826744 isoform X2 [Amaranthus tricolor]